MSKHMVVRKANDLIMAKYKLTLEENRLILYLISMIDRNDTDFQEYEITVKDFCAFSGFPTNNFYRHFRSICDSLLQKRIDLIEEERVVLLCWLSQATYFPRKGKVSLQLPSALKPYLLELKKNFTTYNLQNIRLLRSSASIRIYEILKRYLGVARKTFQVDELKAILGVDKNYSQYSEFKKNVILVAQKELLQKCDICFEFKELKEGRKVDKLEFVICKNTNNPDPDIIDSTCIEHQTPPALEDKLVKPEDAMPEDKQAGRDGSVLAAAYVRPGKNLEDYPPNQQEILRKLSFIEEDLPCGSLLGFYIDAGGDYELIRRRYAYMKNLGHGISNLAGYLHTIILLPEEKFQNVPLKTEHSAPQSGGRKINRFVNFNQRKNDYNEFEKLEMEQFRQAVMGDLPVRVKAPEQADPETE